MMFSIVSYYLFIVYIIIMCVLFVWPFIIGGVLAIINYCVY